MEHTVKDLVEWSGERGKVFGFQSELPYDVTQESFCDPGYSGYKVAQGVQEHAAYGIGVYSYFRDHQCLVPSAILAPDLPGVTFTNTFTKQLNGYGGILSILNGRGPATGPGMARWRSDTTIGTSDDTSTTPCAAAESTTGVTLSYVEVFIMLLASAGAGMIGTAVFACGCCKEMLAIGTEKEHQELQDVNY